MGSYPLCVRPRRSILRRVDANPIRILLEVELIEETLTGRASASDGTTREFAGWLGLLNVLEGLLPDSRPPIDAHQ
jgi:hypothetical protein